MKLPLISFGNVRRGVWIQSWKNIIFWGFKLQQRRFRPSTFFHTQLIYHPF